MKHFISRFDLFVSGKSTFSRRENLFFDKESTAAALDFDDSGRDECNETKSCGPNERCERVSINAQLKRNVCLCDRDNGYRRINGKNQEKKTFRRKLFFA